LLAPPSRLRPVHGPIARLELCKTESPGFQNADCMKPSWSFGSVMWQWSCLRTVNAHHASTARAHPLDSRNLLLYVLVLFHPGIEGRIAVVTDAGWNAVDAEAGERRAAASRTAKSCGPGAPMQGAKLARMRQTHRADDGGKQAGSPGRTRISRKAIAQGRPA